MNSERHTWQVALLVVGVLAVAAAWGVILATGPETSTAGSGTSFVPEPEPEPEPVTVAFLGDSYTAGTGTESATPAEAAFEGYAGLTAVDLDAVPKVYGQGGTGYLNPGQAEENETPYLPRARRIKGDPAVIVVQGGGNDVAMSGYADDIEGAAAAVLSTLAHAHPDAQLVVLGPVLAPEGPTEAELAPVLAGLRAAADDAGAVFVDARRWLPERRLYVEDLVHPNPKGHAVMARLLAKRLAPMTRRP